VTRLSREMRSEGGRRGRVAPPPPPSHVTPQHAACMSGQSVVAAAKLGPAAPRAAGASVLGPRLLICPAIFALAGANNQIPAVGVAGWCGSSRVGCWRAAAGGGGQALPNGAPLPHLTSRATQFGMKLGGTGLGLPDRTERSERQETNTALATLQHVVDVVISDRRGMAMGSD
jgi:hypothetical protein